MRCFFLFGFLLVVGFLGFVYADLKESETDESLDKFIKQKWIKQPVDHFNGRDNRTWSMVSFLFLFFKKTEILKK